MLLKTDIVQIISITLPKILKSTVNNVKQIPENIIKDPIILFFVNRYLSYSKAPIIRPVITLNFCKIIVSVVVTYSKAIITAKLSKIWLVA